MSGLVDLCRRSGASSFLQRSADDRADVPQPFIGRPRHAERDPRSAAAAVAGRSVRCAAVPAKATIPTPGRSRRADRPPEGQISDRLACIKAQSRARKTRLGRSPAGGWETAHRPKIGAPLGRCPRASAPVRLPRVQSPAECAEEPRVRQLGERAHATVSSRLGQPWPRDRVKTTYTSSCFLCVWPYAKR